jgi:hypothetical protein
VTAPEAAAEAARSTASAAPASPPPALETESEETLDDAPVRKSASLAKVLIVSAIIGVAAAGAAVMLTRLESNNRFADRSGVESGAGSRSAPSRPESPSGGSTVPQEMPAPVVPEPTDQAAGTATDSTIAGDAAQQPSGVAVQEGAPAPPAGTSSNATGTPPSNEAHVAQPGVIGDDAASSAIAGSTPETAPKQVAPAQRADDARTPSPADVAAGARASEAQPPDATSPRVSARSAAAATELWGVHVSSFPEQALATDDSLRWSRKQYPVTMVPKEIPDKGLWYRIVLGRFSSKAEAQSFAEDLRAREGLDYVLVMRIPTR